MERMQERVAVVISHVPAVLKSRLQARRADRSMSAEARLAIAEHVVGVEHADREEPSR